MLCLPGIQAGHVCKNSQKKNYGSLESMELKKYKQLFALCFRLTSLLVESSRTRASTKHLLDHTGRVKRSTDKADLLQLRSWRCPIMFFFIAYAGCEIIMG